MRGCSSQCRIIDAWTSVQGRACADLFAGADSVTGQVQTWLEDCDLAIGWTQDLDGKLTETLKAVGVREVIVRSPFSTSIRATHQRNRFLEAINEAPSDDEGDVLFMVTEPLLHLGRACLEAAGLAIGQSLVLIHPGSGSAHKCVAPEILAAVVIALQISGATPVVLEGPADREPVERLVQLCVNPPIVLKGLDVLTVAGVLAQARLFVGQDSGVTHMAGLMGVRTVALFGPTDPDRWAPLWRPCYRDPGRTLPLPIMGRCQPMRGKTLSRDAAGPSCGTLSSPPQGGSGPGENRLRLSCY